MECLRLLRSINRVFLLLSLSALTACTDAVPEVAFMSEKMIPASTNTSSINSSVIASVASVVADGTSQSVVTVTLLDANLIPQVGNVVTLSSDRGGVDSISAASGVSDASGIVTFTVTSSFAGVSTFTATDTTNSVVMNQTAVVTFTAMPASALLSLVASSPSSVVADGFTTSTITVTLINANSNPAVGKSVTLNSDRGVSDTINPVSAISNAAGIATFTVSSLLVGSANFTATVTTDAVVVTQTANVVFTAPPLSPTLSTVVASPLNIVANGTDTSTVTVTLLDVTSAPAAGKTVSLTSNRGATDSISPASVVTNALGVATFTISSTTLGTGTFTAAVPAEFLTITQTAAIDFKLPTSPSASSLVAANSIVIANGVTTTLMTVTLRDAATNPVVGKTVSLASSRGATDIITPVSPVSNASGIATFNVTSMTAGFAIFTATNTSESIVVTQTATLQYYSPLTLAPTVHNMGVNNFAMFTYSGGIGPYIYSLVSGTGTISTAGIFSSGPSAGPAVVRVTDTSTATTADASISIFAAGDYQVISSTFKYSCAITTTGVLKCWGQNLSGRLGVGDTVDRYSPQIVDGGTSYQTVSVGGFHACGITTGGVLKCWGYNNYGQLGNGTTLSSSLPVTIDGGTNYLKVSAGFYHTCAINNTNQLKCWGQNDRGQLGDNTLTNKSNPTLVNGGALYTSVSSGGRHTCAITTSSDLECWGFNDVGQLGDSTIVNKSVPVLIGNNYNSISSGHKHTCAINSGGFLFCWGIDHAGFYNGAPGPVSSPAPIEPATTFSSVSAGTGYSTQSAEGRNHSCAVTTAGVLKCWGATSAGEMGNGALATSPSNPIIINAGTSYLAISVGARHTCGITSANKLRCWGENETGELGLNWSSFFRSPMGLDSTTSYKSVGAGLSSSHACAITSSDNIRCWGQNSAGQIGNGTFVISTVPVSVDGGTTYKQVSTGYNFTCGITLGDVLKCWGYNFNGQLGDGTSTTRNTPVVIDGGSSYVSVSTGYSHSCGITTGQVLKCWGLNTEMQLGNGTTTPSNVPLIVDGGTSYKQVSAGNGFTCGVTVGDVLKCWGKNSNGQIGDGTTTASGFPITIDGGTAYAKVSSGL